MVKIVGRHPIQVLQEDFNHLTANQGKEGAGCKYSICSCAKEDTGSLKFWDVLLQRPILSVQETIPEAVLLTPLTGSTMPSVTKVDPLIFLFSEVKVTPLCLTFCDPHRLQSMGAWWA